MRCRSTWRLLAVGCAVVVGVSWNAAATGQTAERAEAPAGKPAAADDWSLPFDFRPANARIAEFDDAITQAIETANEAGKAEEAKSWQKRLDALNKRRDEAAAGEKSDRAELHVIGLYEGDYILEKQHERADGTRVRGVANVHVTHTATPVILALSSYEPVMWDVRVDKGVRLEKVIVSGYYGSDAAAPQGVPIVGTRPADDERHSWHVHEKSRAEFPLAAAELRTQTGLDIRTFLGAYSPKTQEFVVGPQSESWRDEYLLSAFEALARDATAEARAAMAKRLDAIRFEAPLFTGGDRHGFRAASFGMFSGRGPFADSMQPLPERCGRIVRDVATGECYGIVDHALARFTLAAKPGGVAAVERVALDAGLPEFSHPCGLAFDTRRRRVLVATLGGVGHLYAYDVAKRSWSLIGDLGNRDLCALAYDAKNDAVLGFQAEYGAAGINKVVKLNAKGGAIGELKIVPPIFTGSEHGHGVEVFATVADDWILAVTSNAMNRTASGLGAVTVIDAKTGRGLLSTVQQLQKGVAGVDLKSRDIKTLSNEQERLRAEIERLTRDARAVDERLETLKRDKKPGHEEMPPSGKN